LEAPTEGHDVSFLDDFPHLLDDADFWNKFYGNKVVSR
jgi:hypothetical protein